jgi:hypothetical protein
VLILTVFQDYLSLNFRTQSLDDAIASDMYAALADLASNCGIILGFISQHQQFGTISTNQDYNNIRIRASCDDVLILPVHEKLVITSRDDEGFDSIDCRRVTRN